MEYAPHVQRYWFCRIRGFHPRLWSGHRAAVLFDGGVYPCIPPIPYFVGIVISVGVAMFVGFTIFRGLLTHSVGYTCVPPTAVI